MRDMTEATMKELKTIAESPEFIDEESGVKVKLRMLIGGGL